jgi:hypothetical protein
MPENALEQSVASDGQADDEVSNDAIQLVVISLFNGFCRLMRALAQNGLLTDDQVLDVHDAMTTPLDDPDFRDDDCVTCVRATLEKVLSKALVDAREA